jgi:hypothetical protein
VAHRELAIAFLCSFASLRETAVLHGQISRKAAESQRTTGF